MLKLSDIAGVIFDVDDTLLDNKTRDPKRHMHARSRLAAFYEVGKRRGLAELQAVTPELSISAFMNATEHSLNGTIWRTLFDIGLVSSEMVDPEHELLIEIATLKEILHEDLLRTEGEEVPGASNFVRALAASGLQDHLAIASTSGRRDIDIFLEISGLTDIFPEKRIISREKVSAVKPNPEGYNLAFQSLGLPENARAHVLAFEDDPRGIAAAKAANLFVCAITTACDRDVLLSGLFKPDLIADSYAEFHSHFGLPD